MANFYFLFFIFLIKLFMSSSHVGFKKIWYSSSPSSSTIKSGRSLKKFYLVLKKIIINNLISPVLGLAHWISDFWFFVFTYFLKNIFVFVEKSRSNLSLIHNQTSWIIHLVFNTTKKKIYPKLKIKIII